MEIKVTNMPESKEDKDATYKIEKLVEDRNKSIAKRFGMEPQDVEVKLYFSTAALKFILDPNGDQLGVFGGYVEPSNTIHIAHPVAIGPIFGDNLDKQMSVLADYALTKMYMCKKYYPNREDFKTYYKHIAEALAQFTSGDYREESIKFDIKMYSEGRRYKKDQELLMLFYVMYKNSGLNYIYEHLDKIVEDCDITKTIFTIYRKSINDLLPPIQKEIIDEEKKLRELERAKRQAQRESNANNNKK